MGVLGVLPIELIANEPSLRLLMIEDDALLASAMVRTLTPHGFMITVLHDPRLALAHLADHLDDFDVIVLDVGLPVMSGLQVLARIKQLECITPVVMWTDDERALTAATAMHAGAFGYATKPIVRTPEFVALLCNAASAGELERGARALEPQVASVGPLTRPLGGSQGMCTLRSRIERLARSDITILILGETGTGKELVARSIHELGNRPTGPFVALNCGRVSESLIDSELFGHACGAFSGAAGARAGVFVEADAGTLFLDEIAELPLPAQARLLRAIQDGEVRPVGGDARAIDVRVLAGNPRSLVDAVESKRFREDLYHRLNVATLEIPPLRARMLDVPVLVAHFLRKYGGARDPHLTPAALQALTSYGWPGNVRELENSLLLGLALSAGDAIDSVSLPPLVTSLPRTTVPSDANLPDDLAWARDLSLVEAKKRAVDDFERRYVVDALERARGNMTEAAKISSLDRSNFRRVLTRLGIDVAPFRD